MCEEMFSREKWPTVFPRNFESPAIPSIAGCLINIIKDLEEKFGPRNKDFTFVGIEFYDGNRPQHVKHDKFIIIQLDRSAFFDLNEAISQCAHECVHLLSPIDAKDATYFEEGIATYVEQEVRKSVGRLRPILDQKYIDALDCVEKLLAIDGNIIDGNLIDDNIIKKLRAKEDSISRITKHQLQCSNSEIGDALCDSLLRKFYTEDATC